jgi:hypothetical protein
MPSTDAPVARSSASTIDSSGPTRMMSALGSAAAMSSVGSLRAACGRVHHDPDASAGNVRDSVHPGRDQVLVPADLRRGQHYEPAADVGRSNLTVTQSVKKRELR